MRKEKIITAIDLGTDKCVTLIASSSDEKQSFQVLGVSVVESRGVRKSVIVDLEAALSTISESLDSAERMAGFDVNSAFVSVGGAHVKSKNSKGVVAVADPDGEIIQGDVVRVIEAARAISLPGDRKIIHVIPRDFKVDSQDGIKDPVGMTGVRLESETHIITGMSTSLRNLEKCFNDLGLQIDGFVFSGLAASTAVLSETEKELGVVVVDIGAGSTNFCVFSEGTIIYSGAIQLGARHITQDVALGCRVSLQAAEKIKIHLNSGKQKVMKLRQGESKQEFNKRKRKLDKLDLNELGITESEDSLSKRVIIEGIMIPRMKEIIQAVLTKLEKQNLLAEVPAGIVLSGGGALTVDYVPVIKKYFRLPARVGKPIKIVGLVEDMQKSAFANSIGLLYYGKTHLPDKVSSAGFKMPNVKSFINGLANKGSKLIKSLFP